MIRTTFASACAVTLLVAPPAIAGSLQFWENSLGSPGVTAEFPVGAGLVANIDSDADTAEAGGLLYGATEIDIRPFGAAALVDFACEFPGCSESSDYVFVPGGEGVGRLLVSDPSFQPRSGPFDVGTITFDLQDEGSLELVGCNYIANDGIEHTCSPFVLVSLPEPTTGLGLAACVSLLFGAMRRRRACNSLA